MVRHMTTFPTVLALVVAGLSTAMADGPSCGLAPGEAEEGFVSLFNGKNLDGWCGATAGYVAEDGKLVCLSGGNLLTEQEYADFIFRFEFLLQPNGNNGVAVRAPLEGNPAFEGMEIQILDDTGDRHQQLKPWQLHGSIYGVVSAKSGFLNPPGQWNSEEILCQGSRVRVTLNGTVIVDADLSQIRETPDGRPHPGLHRTKGHLGFMGHGSRVEFRNLRIKVLD